MSIPHRIMAIGCSALMIGGLQLIGPGAAAKEISPVDVLVFYGGLAPLNGRAQPYLRELMDGAAAGKTLSVNPMKAAWNRVTETRLKISAHPIVTTPEQFSEAVGRLFGLSADEVDPVARRAKLDDSNNLALTLVASFEYAVSLPFEDRKTGRKNFKPHFIVGVSAVLSRLGTGRIVASAGAVSEKDGDWMPSATIKSGVAKRKFAEAYKDAAVFAIDRLASLVSKFDGSYPPMDMVSFPVVFDDKWRRMHRVRDIGFPRRHRSVCTMPSLCKAEDGKCLRAVSLIAELATASLSQKDGVNMMPSGLWSHWEGAARGTLDTVVSLNIDTSGGLGVLDRTLKLTFDPKQANRKIVIGLAGIKPDDAPVRSERVAMVQRTYRPDLHAWSYRNCESERLSVVKILGPVDRLI